MSTDLKPVQIKEASQCPRGIPPEVAAVTRRILCVFPRYTSSFGTFDHAYPDVYKRQAQPRHCTAHTTHGSAEVVGAGQARALLGRQEISHRKSFLVQNHRVPPSPSALFLRPPRCCCLCLPLRPLRSSFAPSAFVFVFAFLRVPLRPPRPPRLQLPLPVFRLPLLTALI